MASVRQVYAIRSGGAGLAEAEASFRRAVPEKLVRCLWYDRHWRPSVLHTLTGQNLIVHDPGRWNVQAGPDFQRAVIELAGGIRLRGDVEIHRYASGWTAHRHHLDARYNRVVLHVFLWNDRQATEVRRADGQPVPQLALAPCLPRPLVAYQAEITLEDYPYKHAPVPGRCYETLRQLEAGEVRQFLDRAGDVRLQRRVGRWAERALHVGLSQVMYEAVMRSLGGFGYRLQFQQLARQVLWQELQDCIQTASPADRGRAAEAVLFGLAGMLASAQQAMAIMDRESRSYVEALCRFWDTSPLAIRRRAWSEPVWRQPHVRPANRPERRLAAMAHLLARHAGHDLLEAALATCRDFAAHTHTTAARRLARALAGGFAVSGSSYWSQRSRWGGRKGRSQRLIGAPRALTVVIDAVLPVLLLAARDPDQAALRASLLACYGAAPRLPDNARLRYMARRLLGGDPALLRLVTGARQQQGLLQILDDHCDHDEGDCQGCDFPLRSPCRYPPP